jgi:hypothetical protein
MFISLQEECLRLRKEIEQDFLGEKEKEFNKKMTTKAMAEIRRSLERDMRAMFADRTRLVKEIERVIRPEIEKKVREDLRDRYAAELEAVRAEEREKCEGRIKELWEAYEEGIILGTTLKGLTRRRH